MLKKYYLVGISRAPIPVKRYQNTSGFASGRKWAIHRIEIERSILAAKGFNTNLAHFLPPYHVITSNVMSTLLRARFPTYTDVHLKRFCMPEISCTKHFNLWRFVWTCFFTANQWVNTYSAINTLDRRP